MGLTHRGVCGAALAVALLLTGCSDVPGIGSEAPAASPGAPSPGTTATSVAGSSPSAVPTKKAAPARNDLKSGSAKRTFKAPGISVSVEYSTPLSPSKWTPDVTKPLNVSVTAFTSANRAQKIYLTRVRANISVSDGSGQLDAPDPLEDEANISPGFIVTFPNTYGQVFVIPALDTGAQTVTVDFTYEFLLQVSTSSKDPAKTKDYTKQTARDSITVALN